MRIGLKILNLEGGKVGVGSSIASEPCECLSGSYLEGVVFFEVHRQSLNLCTYVI